MTITQQFSRDSLIGCDIDVVVKCCRDESRFWEEMEKHIDLNNSTHLWLNTANRWTGLRLVSCWTKLTIIVTVIQCFCSALNCGLVM